MVQFILAHRVGLYADDSSFLHEAEACFLGDCCSEALQQLGIVIVCICTVYLDNICLYNFVHFDKKTAKAMISRIFGIKVSRTQSFCAVCLTVYEEIRRII